MRPSELLVSKINPRKAQFRLGWKAKFSMKDVVRMMIENETLHLEMPNQQQVARKSAGGQMASAAMPARRIA